MMKAIDIAKWFIKEGYDEPRNTLNGNMKLQKLLYFAQLIHLAEYDEALFDDPIYAFEHGCVVEDIRLKYRSSNSLLIDEAYKDEYMFTKKQRRTLKLTVDIFGDLDAEELSKLNHLQDVWREKYNNSKIGEYYIKDLSILNIEDMKQNLDGIRQVIKAYDMTNEDDETCELVNDVRFYYNPDEITINEEILSSLREFPAEEQSYSLYLDESVGLVIY